MYIYGIPIAEDDDGNILYRMPPQYPEEPGEDLAVKLYNKERCIGEMHFGAEWIDATPMIWQADIEEGSFPTSWLLWIIYELYRAPVHQFMRIGSSVGDNILGVVAPNGAWLDGMVNEANSDIANLTKQILENLRDLPVKDELSMEIESLLTKSALPLSSLVKKSTFVFAEIGTWQFRVGDMWVELMVYCQKQPEGSPEKTRIAYDLSWRNSDKEHSLFRFSLNDVLHDSELWREEDVFKAWIEKTVVDPIWLIDPDLFEVYSLLDAKPPIFWPFDEFKIWLKETSQ